MAASGRFGTVSAGTEYTLCCDGGATAPQVYRSFMNHWRETRGICPDDDRPACETDVAIGQRIIFAVLAAITEAER